MTFSTKDFSTYSLNNYNTVWCASLGLALSHAHTGFCFLKNLSRLIIAQETYSSCCTPPKCFYWDNGVGPRREEKKHHQTNKAGRTTMVDKMLAGGEHKKTLQLISLCANGNIIQWKSVLVSWSESTQNSSLYPPTQFSYMAGDMINCKAIYAPPSLEFKLVDPLD